MKRLLLCLGLAALTVIQARALQDSTAPESGVQQQSGARRPQARSQQERDDFNAAYALTSAAAEETAANNFCRQVSRERTSPVIFIPAPCCSISVRTIQPKMLAMGERVLELDPDNPLALVLTATALADSLRDRDRDREKKDHGHQAQCHARHPGR